jgi:hypothetical protein
MLGFNPTWKKQEVVWLKSDRSEKLLEAVVKPLSWHDTAL